MASRTTSRDVVKEGPGGRSAVVEAVMRGWLRRDLWCLIGHLGEGGLDRAWKAHDEALGVHVERSVNRTQGR